MATPVLIPVSEYLKTSYRPDCDYLDGEVVERHLGEIPHSGLQGYLAAIFFNHESEWGLIAFPEQRVQVATTRFRVPDLCAVRAGELTGPIVLTPPVLCVEIFSPEDTFGSMRKRMDDYLAFGVQSLWLIDPVGYLAWTVDHAGLHPLAEDSALTIPDTPVRIPLRNLYARLDKLKQRP